MINEVSLRFQAASTHELEAVLAAGKAASTTGAGWQTNGAELELPKRIARHERTTIHKTYDR